MAEDLTSIWHPFNFNKSEIPPCLGAPDKNAINIIQQRKLKKTILQKRKRDIQYFNNHPEIRWILREFISQVSEQRPRQVKEFTRDFFTQPKEKLCEQVFQHHDDFEEIRGQKLFDPDSSFSTSSGLSVRKINACCIKKEGCLVSGHKEPEPDAQCSAEGMLECP